MECGYKLVNKKKLKNSGLNNDDFILAWVWLFSDNIRKSIPNKYNAVGIYYHEHSSISILLEDDSIVLTFMVGFHRIKK